MYEELFLLIRGILDDDVSIIMYKNYKELICNILEKYLPNENIEFIDIVDLYFNFIEPRRSYDNIEYKYTNENKDEIQKKIDYLLTCNQQEQQSAEWFIYRHNHITASSAYKLLINSVAQFNQYIYSKCSPLKPHGFNLESPTHWGHKYEPLSVKYYENKYNTVVGEFGFIENINDKELGSSPDGIVIKRECPRFGRLVEIKNIFNREIDGKPKLEYWTQIQCQQETTDLNFCDFLETRFVEYESKEKFDEDGNFRNSKDENKQKGIFMLFISNGEPLYEYPKWNCNEEEYNKWQNEIMDKHSNLTWIKNIYWKLDEVSCVCVERNKQWFKRAMPYFKNAWNIIQHEKKNGYQHREPKKKKNKIKINVVTEKLEN